MQSEVRQVKLNAHALVRVKAFVPEKIVQFVVCITKADH